MQSGHKREVDSTCKCFTTQKILRCVNKTTKRWFDRSAQRNGQHREITTFDFDFVHQNLGVSTAETGGKRLRKEKKKNKKKTTKKTCSEKVTMGKFLQPRHQQRKSLMVILTCILCVTEVKYVDERVPGYRDNNGHFLVSLPCMTPGKGRSLLALTCCPLHWDWPHGLLWEHSSGHWPVHGKGHRTNWP